MFGKKKNVQAKRGLNALVLASAAAGSIAIPSMINALSTLRLALPVQQPPPSQDFNTAKTRAKSLGAVAFNATTPTSPPNTSTSPQKCPSTDSLRHPKSAPLPRPLASTAAGVAPAAEDEDWDAEIAHTSSSTCPTSTLVLAPSSGPLSLPPFPRKPAVTRARVQPRRVVSAPATPSLFFLEDETGVPAGRGVVDAMWEPLCEDAFMVASVRQKVLARRERELERSVSAEAGLESWDDDFCCFEGQEEELVGGRGRNNGLGALKVPEYLGNVQEALRVDADNIRKFALHIEDLKLLFMDSQDISMGVEFDAPELVQPLILKYAAVLERAQVLIHLGDFNDDNAAAGDAETEQLLSDEMHVRVLGELLGDSVGVGRIALSKLKMEFSGAFVPVLLKGIAGVKGELSEYVKELRRVSREVC